ncbi:divergent polysaccharide deacetylase family protein [Gallaecimonas sp. GXIMD4217]|uniref:divergent polysaccharide deacetylase family protein n=1 Tax=Gallaecimonas sp. GXIMD4217 TaxID=3131927 RepID=UPI00311AD54F
MRFLLSALIGLLLPLAAQAKPRLAIIIDDLGYKQGDFRVLELPRTVALGIMPHTPYGRSLASRGQDRNHVIMLHLPMEPEAKLPLEPHTLTTSMNRSALAEALEAALADIPQARGVNNHMGSAMTQSRPQMDWLMGELGRRGLFFVDSRTTAKSQAMAAARMAGIPAVERKVFLDNSPDQLDYQWQRALTLAEQHGQVVVIGHPHDHTLAFLGRALSNDQLAVELVPITALMAPEHWASSDTMTDTRG